MVIISMKEMSEPEENSSTFGQLLEIMSIVILTVQIHTHRQGKTLLNRRIGGNYISYIVVSRVSFALFKTK